MANSVIMAAVLMVTACDSLFKNAAMRNGMKNDIKKKERVVKRGTV